MLENLTAMEMLQSMSTRSVEQLFLDGLARANSLVTTTALKVIAKRGEYFRVYAMVMETFFGDEKQGIPLNSGDFCMTLGQSLMELKKADYVLWRIGTRIVLAKERYDNGNSSRPDYYTEEELITDLGASLQLPAKEGEYNRSDLKELNKDRFESSRYIQDLLTLGLKHREFRLVEAMIVYGVLQEGATSIDLDEGMRRYGYELGNADTERLAQILLKMRIEPKFGRIAR